MLDALAGVPVAFGFALGLSLAAPPGPINALILTRAAKGGFFPGFVVGAGATSGDAFLALLMALGVARILEAFPTVRAAVTLAGGLLMLYFAWVAFRSARHIGAAEAAAEDAAARRSLGAGVGGGYATGFVLALTSPYNFAWWVSSGTALFQSFGAIIFVGFFAGILAWVATLAGVVTWARSRAAGLLRGVAYASAGLLVAFALYLAWQGATGLAALA